MRLTWETAIFLTNNWLSSFCLQPVNDVKPMCSLHLHAKAAQGKNNCVHDGKNLLVLPINNCKTIRKFFLRMT
jgi:hypothetical protein